ncbi:MAG: DM13 domain-containing protein [bacterium]|nr:DM13 domain-containing protein [bacterium]
MQVVAAIVAIAVLAVAWWLISPLFIDEVVEEEFPRAAMAVVPDDMTAEEAEEVMMEAEAVETMVAEEMPESEEPDVTGPVALATGALMDADDFHRGSGEVTAYRLEDGSHVLRLEDIEVTNGPDLRVLVAPGHGIDSREALQAAGYIELAPLKGNIGSQNYDFPAGYQIPEQMTVVIYCKPFHVIFATAELS